MALSYVQFQGDGTQQTFPVPFSYIHKDHIEVRVALDVTPFTWDDPQTIRISPAPEGLVEIRRITPRDVRMVDFVDASVLTEGDLDLNSIQTFYIVQEAIDIAGGTLELLPDGSYGAGGRRISDIGTAVGPRDAITKEYHDGTWIPQMDWLRAAAQGYRDEALGFKDTAVSARDAAIAARDTAQGYRDTTLGARDAALGYRDTAEAHKNAAATSASNASTYEGNALSYRNTAEAHKNAAAGSASTATTKATEATVAAEGAYNWAEKTGGPVTGSLYSAKHWAQAAAASAVAAATFDPSSYYPKSQTYTRTEVDAKVVQATPPGAVMAFAMNAPPTGWLACNGAIVSRATFAALYAAIGDTFGAGDGTSTFQLPDLRGEFVRGVDNGRTADTGRPFGSWQGEAIQSHAHGVYDPGHVHGVHDPGHAHSIYDPGHAHNYYGTDLTDGTGAQSGSANRYGWMLNTAVSGTGIGIYAAVTGIWLAAAVTGISIYAAGGPETRPRNVALLYCIKT